MDTEAAEGTGGRSVHDRPNDPLYPILPTTLEAIKATLVERTANEAVARDPTPSELYSAIIETICGANDDSQPVEQYDGTLGVTRQFVDAHQAAVGQIQWNDDLAAKYTNSGNVSGERWCTGTLIGEDLFLTAGHCFDQTGGGWERPRINGTSNIIPSTEIATNMHVNFNFQVDPNGVMRVEQSFPIQQLVEYRLGGLDFAIIQLGGNPTASFGQAHVSTTDASGGDMLCIIGHPAGQPKRVEAGPALAPSGNQILYDDIDTLGGNSGSGVVRASDGRIVGVHTNGGCSPSSPGAGGGANSGMRIAAVIAASPTLRRLIAPKSLASDAGVTSSAGDVIGTAVSRDVIGTSRVADNHATGIAADFGTAIVRDVLGTGLSRDQLGTGKNFDDVKTPAFDKQPFSDTKRPGVDGGLDPFRDRGDPIARLGGHERPFALATPHHTMAWEQPAPAGRDDLEHIRALLNQIREDMAQLQEALTASADQYDALIVEYAAAGGETESPGGA
nr:trypsin-like peptidase domain-containing protein [uncultured Novosphingobium sp.]